MSNDRTDRPTEEGAPASVRSVIRYALVLSAVAMIAMAGLTFAGLMPFAPWIGMLFLIVAAFDLLIGFAVFHK